MEFHARLEIDGVHDDMIMDVSGVHVRDHDTLVSLKMLRQLHYRLWRQVEQAQKKSLPQTVVKLTEKIYRKAELEKNAPQMLKAYICREAYQERLTPDSLYTNLKKLESLITLYRAFLMTE
jgi:hypothetical protein